MTDNLQPLRNGMTMARKVNDKKIPRKDTDIHRYLTYKKYSDT